MKVTEKLVFIKTVQSCWTPLAIYVLTISWIIEVKNDSRFTNRRACGRLKFRRKWSAKKLTYKYKTSSTYSSK